MLLGAAFPDQFLLARFEPWRIFCDEKSHEDLQEKMTPDKRKYKMADKSVLNTYIFFVSTSKVEATSSHTTVCIESHEWTDCFDGYLKNESYFDARRVHILTKSELLSKIRDPENLFKHVATFPESRRKDFELVKQRTITKTDTAPRVKSMLLASILPNENECLDILKSLGL